MVRAKDMIKIESYIPNAFDSSKAMFFITTDGTIENDNFLKISFGIGDIAANIAIDSHKLSFTYENPILKEQLTDIQNSSLTMKKVPIPISLITNKLLPLCPCSCNMWKDCFNYFQYLIN